MSNISRHPLYNRHDGYRFKAQEAQETLRLSESAFATTSIVHEPGWSCHPAGPFRHSLPLRRDLAQPRLQAYRS